MAGVFNFEIFESTALSVSHSNARGLIDVAVATQLGLNSTCEVMRDVLVDEYKRSTGDEGYGLPPKISKPQYDSALRTLLPGVNRLSDAEKAQVNLFFSNIFYAFDHDSEEMAPTDELLVGLSLVSGGSKTNKLAFAFSLFDVDGTETIEQFDLLRLLGAFLTALFAVTDDGALPPDVVATAVQESSMHNALRIFADLGIEDEAPLDFDAFGAWYNQVGYQVVPWLELLDLSKWPLPSEAEVAAAEAVDMGAAAASADDEAMISFDFPAPFSVKVSITNADVRRFSKVVTLTELYKKHPSEVADLFLEASEDGILSKRDFDKCLRQLIPRRAMVHLNAGEIEELSTAYSAFFLRLRAARRPRCGRGRALGGVQRLVRGQQVGEACLRLGAHLQPHPQRPHHPSRPLAVPALVPADSDGGVR